MTLEYSQFGGPDYGGFTTEEELQRRRYIVGSERGSPAIGARFSAYGPSQIPAGLPSAYSCGTGQLPTPPPPLQDDPIELRESGIMADAIARQEPTAIAAAQKPITVADALKQLMLSRPVSALDWILIIIIIIAVIGFFEYANEILAPILHGNRATDKK